MFCHVFKSLQCTQNHPFQRLAGEVGGVAFWIKTKTQLECGIVLQAEEFCANMQTFYQIFDSAAIFSLAMFFGYWEKPTTFYPLSITDTRQSKRERGAVVASTTAFSIFHYLLSIILFPLSIIRDWSQTKQVRNWEKEGSGAGRLHPTIIHFNHPLSITNYPLSINLFPLSFINFPLLITDKASKKERKRGLVLDACTPALSTSITRLSPNPSII